MRNKLELARTVMAGENVREATVGTSRSNTPVLAAMRNATRIVGILALASLGTVAGPNGNASAQGLERFPVVQNRSMSGRDSGIGAVIDHHTNTAAIEHPSWFPTMGSATADHARVFPGNDNPLVSFIGGGVGAAIASHIGHRHTVAKAILGAMLGRAVARHLEQVRHPVTSLPPAPLDEQNRSPTPGRY